jgi:hypothetical protein
MTCTISRATVNSTAVTVDTGLTGPHFIPSFEQSPSPWRIRYFSIISMIPPRAGPAVGSAPLRVVMHASRQQAPQ